jgi:hypothetical protein
MWGYKWIHLINDAWLIISSGITQSAMGESRSFHSPVERNDKVILNTAQVRKWLLDGVRCV